MAKDEPPRDRDKSSPAEKQDVVFIHSPVQQGEGFHVIRRREDRIELGEIRPTEDGRPLHGELVKLTPRDGQRGLFDVQVLLEAPPQTASTPRHTGPAQVATDAYRSNWDEIFGERARSKSSAN